MKWTDKESYSLPVVLAVGLHVVVLGVGVVAMAFGDDTPPAPKRPPIVNATVVDVSDTIIGKREAEKRQSELAAAQAAEEAKRKAQEAARQQAERKAVEQQRQAARAAQERKEAAERKAEADRQAAIKRQEAERERARKAEQERKLAEQRKAKQEAERQKQAEAERQRQAEAERQRREKERAEELAQQREAERKAAEEARRKRAEAEVQKAIAEEEARQRAIEEGQAVQSISSLIMSRIASGWIRPPSARNGMTTKLRIGFLPNGEVVNVDVVEGSGDALFDQRAKDAVSRMGRVEELADIDYAIFERNFRQIELLFNPQDLRN